jgi:hypothetical protein
MKTRTIAGIETFLCDRRTPACWLTERACIERQKLARRAIWADYDLTLCIECAHGQRLAKRHRVVFSGDKNSWSGGMSFGGKVKSKANQRARAAGHDDLCSYLQDRTGKESQKTMSAVLSVSESTVRVWCAEYGIRTGGRGRWHKNK